MATKPTLLIIVPTLNSYKVLPRLIKSLKIQSYKDWELLLVDGNSSKIHEEWIIDCCRKDLRINYIKQEDKYKGIYGAMNQGTTYARESDWIFFWGSDDWACSEKTFFNVMNIFNKYKKNNYKNLPHLIIGRGIYIDSINGKEKRLSKFDESKKFIKRSRYLRKIFFGETPPHQGTLIGPRARLETPLFNDKFLLTADLYFMLNLSKLKDLKVEIIKEDIVYIEDAGVSARFMKLRIIEVIKTYFIFFKFFFFIPFFARYIRRIISKKI
ncbi:glycosyltransferase [Prochlorococcus marinus]|uniref:glycosyltransferase n=1 Tax=Prochlorococcus marinus TaxID=1219 RepID=UPI00094D072D|nr:glycosyltransferase [Prochlorococcus marinus]